MISAIDHVGLSSVAISVPVTLDTTPPDIGSITVGGHMKHLYLLSSKQLRIHWTGFEDKESGIDKFFVGVGDLADIDNVKGFVEVSDQYADMSCKVFVDGKTYIAVLKVSPFDMVVSVQVATVHQDCWHIKVLFYGNKRHTCSTCEQMVSNFDPLSEFLSNGLPCL